MALDNEQIVRQAYKIAEDMDMAAWVAAFTEDGTFTDESIGVTWKDPPNSPCKSRTTIGPSPTCTASFITSMSAATLWWV